MPGPPGHADYMLVRGNLDLRDVADPVADLDLRKIKFGIICFRPNRVVYYLCSDRNLNWRIEDERSHCDNRSEF
jgi:hypothetical protein